MLTIGDRLRIARDLKGVKQTKVSDDTGINNKTLSGYERDISEPDIDTIKILAEYYNISLDYLLGKTDNATPYKELYEKVDIKEEYKEEIEALEKFRSLMLHKGHGEYEDRTLKKLAEELIQLNLFKEAIKSKDNKSN